MCRTAILIGLTFTLLAGASPTQAQFDRSNNGSSDQFSSRRGARPVRLIRHLGNQGRNETLQKHDLVAQVEQLFQDTAPRTRPGETAPFIEAEPRIEAEQPYQTEPQLETEPQLNPAGPSVSVVQDLSGLSPVAPLADACPDCQYDAYGCGYDSCGDNRRHYQVFPSYRGWQFGGWLQTGYHSESTGLLNNRPDELNLQQGWFTFERRANNCQSGWDWGFRFDAVYGTDAYFLQSFGNNLDTYDFQNGQNRGAYAWAFPQLYAEIKNGGWGVKVGHFLADFNYETYRSPTNFFYSRSYASVLGAPSTLSGVIASYDDGCTVWSGGYAAGWDTGFDRFLNGGSFYGSVKRRLSNNSSLSYTTIAGDFGRRGTGYSHSIIYDRNFACRWNYAFETSYLQSDLIGGGRNDNAGITQYLTYNWSDKLDIGQRLEWWKSDINNVGSQSTYAYTAGLNYRVSSNINIRPEVRYNWGAQFNNAAMQTANFGVDAVIRF